MKIRKLSAISSTNDYLKELYAKKDLDDFTVISTDYQTSGKGQGVNKWTSKKGKNLLFSVLVKNKSLEISNIPFLNFSISVAIYQVLKQYLSQVEIKWPNDIMAGNKKICGVLIENVIRKSVVNHSIIGIGLNVNQISFPENLPNASSLSILLSKEIDLDLLLKELIFSIQKQISILEEKQFSILKNTYEEVLYKKGTPSMFKSKRGKIFMGKIIGVSDAGLLQIELENGIITEFANKEVKLHTS